MQPPTRRSGIRITSQQTAVETRFSTVSANFRRDTEAGLSNTENSSVANLRQRTACPRLSCRTIVRRSCSSPRPPTHTPDHLGIRQWKFWLPDVGRLKRDFKFVYMAANKISAQQSSRRACPETNYRSNDRLRIGRQTARKRPKNTPETSRQQGCDLRLTYPAMPLIALEPPRTDDSGRRCEHAWSPGTISRRERLR